MSVEVIDTSEGMASCATSAKDGRPRPLCCSGRVAAGVVRWASDLGVMLMELATTMPNTTAAATSADRDNARLVVLSIFVVFLFSPKAGSLFLSHQGNARPSI